MLTWDLDWPKSWIWKTPRHWNSTVMALSNTSNEGIWEQFSNSMRGIKSAKLEIYDLALLIPCI